MKKRRGHYCKVCGQYKANEKFSGKGHAAHICKACAKLSPKEKAENTTLNRLYDLPWHLSKEQIKWLRNRTHDQRPEVRAAAQEQYDMRFRRYDEEDELPEDDFELDELDEDEFDGYDESEEANSFLNNDDIAEIDDFELPF